MKNRPIKDIHWLSDEEYQKTVGSLRLQMANVFSCFDTYGLGIFIPGAINEAVRLAEDFGLRVRGVDKIISLEMIRGIHMQRSGDPRSD